MWLIKTAMVMNHLEVKTYKNVCHQSFPMFNWFLGITVDINKTHYFLCVGFRY